MKPTLLGLLACRFVPCSSAKNERRPRRPNRAAGQLRRRKTVPQRGDPRRPFSGFSKFGAKPSSPGAVSLFSSSRFLFVPAEADHRTPNPENPLNLVGPCFFRQGVSRRHAAHCLFVSTADRGKTTNGRSGIAVPLDNELRCVFDPASSPRTSQGNFFLLFYYLLIPGANITPAGGFQRPLPVTFFA